MRREFAADGQQSRGVAKDNPIACSDTAIDKTDGDTPAMELYQLRTFVAVAREGNLSRAAEKLFTSQPAISAQVKALELTLGVQLFKRTPRGMELTVPGRTLLNEAEKTLDAARSVVQRARGLRDALEGTLNIGTISQPAALRLGAFLVALSTCQPGLDIRIRQGVSGVVVRGVATGELDAGFVIGEVDADLVAERVAPVTLVVALPSGRADADAPWGTVAELPWITTPAECSFTRLSTELFACQGSSPRRTLEADQESALRELVASGVGASLLRLDQAEALESDGRCTIWRGPRVDTTLFLVFRRDRADDPMLRAVRDATAQTWSS